MMQSRPASQVAAFQALTCGLVRTLSLTCYVCVSKFRSAKALCPFLCVRCNSQYELVLRFEGDDVSGHVRPMDQWECHPCGRPINASQVPFPLFTISVAYEAFSDCHF